MDTNMFSKGLFGWEVEGFNDGEHGGEDGVQVVEICVPPLHFPFLLLHLH